MVAWSGSEAPRFSRVSEPARPAGGRCAASATPGHNRTEVLPLSGGHAVRAVALETEIDMLIRKGMLKADARNDPGAVCKALYAHLDRTLGAMP
jgi:hypothetical protein